MRLTHYYSISEVRLTVKGITKSKLIQKLPISRLGIFSLNLLSSLLYLDIFRPLLTRLGRSLVRVYLNEKGAPPDKRRIVHERKLLSLSIVRSVERSMKKGFVSLPVIRKVTALWVKALFIPSRQRHAVKNFKEQYHRAPPWFLAISPGRGCNLRCPGCYSSADGEDKKLSWHVLNRLVNEARSLWDIKVVVLSGGEPLAYQSEGKSIIDLVESHPDLMFLMFTNGTLLTEPIAARLAELGNLTAAFSVEGMRHRTDQRRGSGIFDTVTASMANMRRAGLPFGISVTVTRDNVEEVLSGEFLDYFFEQQGAFYAFYFQYMPIGRKPDFEIMPTPAQRIEFWKKAWRIIEERQLFLIDFWNHGTLVKGCIAAGRGGGYLHVDWNGNVMPCVFAPYSAGNIHEIYSKGGNLNNLWEAPFLETIRKWQDSYGYAEQELSPQANWLRPCPFRDHHSTFEEWIGAHQPEPEDEAAGEALLDTVYCQRLQQYGKDFADLCQNIWEKEYLSHP